MRRPPRTYVIVLAVVVVAAAVLRVWRVSGMRLIWDEAFTGATARLPLGDLVAFLRGHDVHPPLDYLLRGPIAAHTTSAGLLRLPSVLASLAAVVLIGWWLRRRPLLGIVAACLMAVVSFQLTYAWQARPYAVMVLVGLALAVLSHRWLGGASTRLAILAGLVLLIGCLESETCTLLAVGLLFVPGLRGDKAAWVWRATLAGAVGVWLAVWGPVLVDQLPHVAVRHPSRSRPSARSWRR